MNGKYVKYSYTQICPTQPKCFLWLSRTYLSIAIFDINGYWSEMIIYEHCSAIYDWSAFFLGFNVLIGHGEQLTYFLGGLKPPRNHVDLMSTFTLQQIIEGILIIIVACSGTGADCMLVVVGCIFSLIFRFASLVVGSVSVVLGLQGSPVFVVQKWTDKEERQVTGNMFAMFVLRSCSCSRIDNLMGDDMDYAFIVKSSCWQQFNHTNTVNLQ